MNSLLIINPVAGQTRAEDLIPSVLEALRPHVEELAVTRGRGDAENAARRAASPGSGFDAVLVAGGDGTINEVINGLRVGAVEGGGTLPLGIVAGGTQNVLAHELGLPIADLDATAAMIARGQTRAIDLGVANGRYFALMAGFGFDAAVVGDVVHPIKELLGPAAYGFAALSALARYESTSVTVRIDDDVFPSHAYLIVVSNASSYAYRQIKLAPFASVTDGWLDVCVFERAPTERIGFITQIMAVLARRHLRDPRVRYFRARRIVIESDPPIRAQLDGDMYGDTPYQIEIAPKALDVFVT